MVQQQQPQALATVGYSVDVGQQPQALVIIRPLDVVPISGSCPIRVLCLSVIWFLAPVICPLFVR